MQKQWKAIVAAASLLAGLATAEAASTINTSIPATGSALQSGPVRGNFLAAATDINNILGMFAGSSAPSTPSVGQDWLNTSSSPNTTNKWDGAVWVQTGTWDRSAHLFTPAIGNPLLAWQELIPGGLGITGQCVTSNGTSTAPTPQNCVSATTFVATAPLAWNSGTLTVSLNLDSNFTVTSSNLALNPISSGQLIANAGAGSAEPTGTSLSTYLDRTIGAGAASNGMLPYRTGGVWSNISTGTSGGTIPLNNTANVFSAVQTVNLNAASLPTALAGSALRVGQADATIGRIEIDSFGTTSPGVLSVVHGRGTGASPTALLSGDEIGSFNAWGYTGAATQTATAVAAFRSYAAENFSSGHQGSKACLSSTPLASTTLTDGLCQQTGVVIGTPTGGDQGAGTLNVAGALYVNGAIVPAPTPTRAGDVIYWNGSTWVTLAGNNSGTQVLQENSSGVPSWATVSGSGTVTSITCAATLTCTATNPITTTGTVALNLGNANTWTAVQTFTNSDLALLGSSTGSTTFTSANSGASNFTITVPAVTSTLYTQADTATNTQIWSATANKVVDGAGLNNSQNPVTLTDAATVALDMSTFINGNVTLAGNRTLGNPSNTQTGRCGFIVIIQDATGGRTLAYSANWKFSNGNAPVLSTAANAVDFLHYCVRTSSFIEGNLLTNVK